jgi:lipopolysaccharide biosynthesis protein
MRALSELGDIIFVTDCDTHFDELSKTESIPNVIHTIAERHGEYDFGSYKRGYFWAAEKGILSKYDWIYFVNDSAYGPLRPLGPVLKELESKGNDIVGMHYINRHPMSPYMQSWFVGMTQNIAREKWVADFLRGIRRWEDKRNIIMQYELGFSMLFARHGCRLGWLLSGPERDDGFRNPVRTLWLGMPFLKKSEIALANIRDANRIRAFIPDDVMPMIRKDMHRRGINFGRYHRVISFRLFGLIPVLDINKCWNKKKYKVILFKYIPIFSINL